MSKKDVLEQKCPSCGAPMRYDAASGKLVCDWCGTVLEIEDQEIPSESPQQEPEEKVSGFDYEAIKNQVIDKDAQELPIYHCKSCGAELISAWEQVSLTCPYCRNNIVLTDKVAGGLRPDGIVPFTISSSELPQAVSRFYKNKKLLPKGFFSRAGMGNVTGLYVPFWVFEGRLEGNVNFAASRSVTYREGNYRVTDTKHYSLNREVSVDFDQLPVDASERLDDALMDSLEPFDLSAVKDFDPAYLAGFAADRFDAPASDVEARAKKRMLNTAYASARNRCNGYESVTERGGNIMAQVKARYLLLPVYIFDIIEGRKSYSFAVNGQSGKVVGELPNDKAYNFKYFLLRAGAVLGAFMLYSVARYFMGA
ncbi:MAG: hypothetical protein IJM17_08615 [Firmicutes bacterium]|nr:hypothetical protein [Bacillota bacterium]